MIAEGRGAKRRKYGQMDFLETGKALYLTKFKNVKYMRMALDACTVILLAKAGVLEDLVKAHTTFIPEGAYKEVVEGKKDMLADALITERLVGERLLEVVKSKDTKMLQKLEGDFGLGKGESETINIYFEKKLDAVATDNRQGRKTAKIHAIPLLGSPEIIVHLFKVGKIDRAKALLALKSLEEFGWFDGYLLEKAKDDLMGK